MPYAQTPTPAAPAGMSASSPYRTTLQTVFADVAQHASTLLLFGRDFSPPLVLHDQLLDADMRAVLAGEARQALQQCERVRATTGTMSLHSMPVTRRCLEAQSAMVVPLRSPVGLEGCLLLPAGNSLVSSAGSALQIAASASLLSGCLQLARQGEADRRYAAGLRADLDLLDEGWVREDGRHEVADCNAAFCEQFDLHPIEVLGTPLATLVPAAGRLDRDDDTGNPLCSYVHDEAHHADLRLLARAHDNETTLIIRRTPTPQPDAAALHHQRLATLGRLSADGHAGLVNELSAVISEAELITALAQDMHTTKLAGRMMGQAQYVREQLNRLRTFSRDDRSPVATELGGVVQEALALADPALRQLGVQVQSLLSAEPCLLRCQPATLCHALVETLLYTAELCPARVNLSTRQSEQHAVVTLELQHCDNAAAQHPARLHTANELLSRANGRLLCYHTGADGLQLVMELPLEAPGDDPPRDTGNNHEKTPGQRRVLLIDLDGTLTRETPPADDPALTCELARNVAEAEHLLRQTTYDTVFVALSPLPHFALRSYAWLKQLKKLHSSRLVLITPPAGDDADASRSHHRQDVNALLQNLLGAPSPVAASSSAIVA